MRPSGLVRPPSAELSTGRPSSPPRRRTGPRPGVGGGHAAGQPPGPPAAALPREHRAALRGRGSRSRRPAAAPRSPRSRARRAANPVRERRPSPLGAQRPPEQVAAECRLVDGAVSRPSTWKSATMRCSFSDMFAGCSRYADQRLGDAGRGTDRGAAATRGPSRRTVPAHRRSRRPGEHGPVHEHARSSRRGWRCTSAGARRLRRRRRWDALRDHIRPCLMSTDPGVRPVAARLVQTPPAARSILSGAHRSSSSQNATHVPVVAASPRLRAAPTPAATG